MFKDLDFDVVMTRMLDRIDDRFDKRETSICYQSVAMVVPEIITLKSELEIMELEAFPDTCSHKNLLRFCKFRGIEPYPSSSAEVKAVFNIDVDIGSRFNSDLRNYKVIEQLDGEHTYRLVAEEQGPVISYGDLTPIEDIPGLQSAKITEILIDGKEEEETEHLRKRYIESLDYQAFGGNRVDYKYKILALEGVGAVKLFRRKGATSAEINKVECVILDSTFTGCESSLVEYVQKRLYPESGEPADGVGLAPIGHIVKVYPVNKQEITIHTHITLDKSISDVNSDIKDAIDEYFRELSANFGSDEEENIIRISHIENRILNIKGVIDVERTTLNGLEKNLVIDERSIPHLKGVSYDKQ